MYVYIVTGKSGHVEWPAKVFKSEFAAHLFARLAPIAAKACRNDRLSISQTESYNKLTDAEVLEVEQVILSPYNLIDPECPVLPAIWHTITYNVKRVALHD